MVLDIQRKVIVVAFHIHNCNIKSYVNLKCDFSEQTSEAVGPEANSGAYLK